MKSLLSAVALICIMGIGVLANYDLWSLRNMVDYRWADAVVLVFDVIFINSVIETVRKS